jgi:putative ABC transport system ATP-binding protein
MQACEFRLFLGKGWWFDVTSILTRHRVEPVVEPVVEVSAVVEPLIRLVGLDKTYRTGKLEYRALRSVDLEVGAGEMVAVVGPSGSGKTTIMNMITGIDAPTTGEVIVGGRRISSMKEEALAAWRGANVGIVFQFFQLLPTLTAIENTMLPLDFARKGSRKERRDRAALCLELVGLGDKHDHLPSELSGGEQQRVAIARALAPDPALLIGDEPTGNLDSETARQMFELLADLNRQGKTVLYVTHDPELARRAPRRVTIRDGQVVPEEEL